MIFKPQSNRSGLYVNNVMLCSNRSLNRSLNRNLTGAAYLVTMELSAGSEILEKSPCYFPYLIPKFIPMITYMNYVRYCSKLYQHLYQIGRITTFVIVTL